MSNIIPLPGRHPGHEKPSDLLEKAFSDWMGEDELCEITLLVRIDAMSSYDCGYPTREVAEDVVELGGFEVMADLTEKFLCERPYKIDLYYPTQSREDAEAMRDKLVPGSFAMVTGYGSIWYESDGEMVFTIHPKNVAAVRVVPEEYLPVARHWLRD